MWKVLENCGKPRKRIIAKQLSDTIGISKGKKAYYKLENKRGKLLYTRYAVCIFHEKILQFDEMTRVLHPFHRVLHIFLEKIWKIRRELQKNMQVCNTWERKTKRNDRLFRIYPPQLEKIDCQVLYLVDEYINSKLLLKHPLLCFFIKFSESSKM